MFGPLGSYPLGDIPEDVCPLPSPEWPLFSGIRPEIMPDYDLRRKLRQEDATVLLLLAAANHKRRKYFRR
jgi:hypothetical protein